MSTVARQQDEASQRAIAPAVVWVGAGAALVAIVTALFWDFFRTQYAFATSRPEDWGHTLAIPFIAGYFVYLKRESLARETLRTAWIGLIPLLLGVFIYTACVVGPQPLHHHNFRGAGLSITLFGIVLTLGGWRVLGRLLFPLLYLCVFGQVISEVFMEYVTFPLQDLTARGAHLLLNVLQIETERSGNTLYVIQGAERKALNVAEACSGMRMLIAFLALGVAIAYTGLRRSWQRTLLVVLGVPIAIFVNMLRVMTLGILSLYDINFAQGEFHHFIGLVWLIPAFLLFLGVLWILRHMVIEDEGAGAA
jgi:exosortase